MSKEKGEFAYVKLSDIQPDENQPRKYFSAEKMHSLSESIKREGIITPLVVEKVGNKYLLVDGERRFRAATELRLEKVPVVVEEPKKAIERLIRQFTVQEQHEAWTPVEKAMALINLSAELGITLREVCKLLNVADTEARRYVAFASLADKETWVRSEVPITFAEYITAVKSVCRRVSEQDLNKEFTQQDEKKLERRIVIGIKDGTIQRRTDITKLSDSFIKDPKSLKKFMEDIKITPTALYLEVGAQGSHALRNVMYNTSYILTHGTRFLNQKDVKINPEQVRSLKGAREVLGKMIALAE